MKRTPVVEILNAKAPQASLLVKGWVRTKRDSKGFFFLEINDGSCLTNLQVVVDEQVDINKNLPQISTGASIKVIGDLVESPGKGQKWEIRSNEIELIGSADPKAYPLQKKRHSDEFLRSIAHLRPRTNKYGALNRIRSEAALAIHDYFHKHGFLYIHTPIITSLDCEGAGELFRVTAFDLEKKTDKEELDKEDFFGKKAYLTVSGQLTAEIMACSLGKVYTFGPTFRAEDSNTPRHAAEFWMVEPEVAFADLFEIMDLAEDMIKSVISNILGARNEDLNLFSRFVDKNLLSTLDKVLAGPFVRLTYTEAIKLLEDSAKKWEYPVSYGADLQTEHERFLADEYFQKPIIVYNYPKQIKPFYMRENDDGVTVAGMDVLLPRVGEIIGGSQREERLEVLNNRMEYMGLNKQEYNWYLDLRRYGTIPHAGFGLGFERLLMFLTGIHNIRDVLPFPRTPNNLEF